MPDEIDPQGTSSNEEGRIVSDDTNTRDASGIDRRHFLTAAGVAAAGLGAAGLGVNAASAKTIVPGEVLKTNATKGGKRVAINLVIAQPADGLVEELEGHGAKVVVVPGIEQEGPNDESQPGSTQKLVDAAMENFGGFDSAYIRTARHMAGGILDITAKDMQALYESNFLAVIYSLQALMPPLMEKGAGQILILTSASSEKPLYDFAGYSAIRAGANKLIQCAAMTAAPKGVCINAFGTNFLNYPDAVNALGGKEAMEEIAKNIPVGRFGEPEEMAHFAMALLDGRNMYTTGQSFMVAGGYNVALDSGHFA
jgi:3-oxoacyl-[acyl-carrier protein] reductase